VQQLPLLLRQGRSKDLDHLPFAVEVMRTEQTGITPRPIVSGRESALIHPSPLPGDVNPGLGGRVTLCGSSGFWVGSLMA
jgi:hypothetical protein